MPPRWRQEACSPFSPIPIVCFAGADFTQTQRYELHGDASLAFVDWMTSGRHEAGERWAFSRYESRLDDQCAMDVRSLRDAVVLEHDLDSIAERMGRFEVLLTAVLTGTLVSEAAEMMLRRSMHGRRLQDSADLIVSASMLRRRRHAAANGRRQRRSRSAGRFATVFRFSLRSSATIPGAGNGDHMHLTPHELDKLALHQAGYLAQKRLARGLRLNYPEAVALISTQVLEFIRDGRSVAELMDLGRQLLGRADVMDRCRR